MQVQMAKGRKPKEKPVHEDELSADDIQEIRRQKANQKKGKERFLEGSLEDRVLKAVALGTKEKPASNFDIFDRTGIPSHGIEAILNKLASEGKISRIESSKGLSGAIPANPSQAAMPVAAEKTASGEPQSPKKLKRIVGPEDEEVVRQAIGQIKKRGSGIRDIVTKTGYDSDDIYRLIKKMTDSGEIGRDGERIFLPNKAEGKTKNIATTPVEQPAPKAEEPKAQEPNQDEPPSFHGWKLHLDTDHPEEVSAILQQQGLKHKVGRNDEPATAQPKEPKTEQAPAQQPAPAGREKIDVNAPPLVGFPDQPSYRSTYLVDPKQIGIDPGRFQFKLDAIGSRGVTDKFKNSVFNPKFQGIISCWKDPKDGKTYVINGHHRLDMALKAGSPDVVISYIQAKDEKEARAEGALMNIADDNGTAVDAAKFMKDTGMGPEAFAKEGLSVKGGILEKAGILTGLAEPLFKKLVQGELPESWALAIAGNLKDHAHQQALLQHIEQRVAEGNKYDPDEIAFAAQEAADAPKGTKTTSTLFGDETEEKSYLMERAELKSHIKQELGKAMRTFKFNSKDDRAEALSGHGNTINVAGNKEQADKLSHYYELYNLLARTKSPISDIINEESKNYGEAGKAERKAIKERAVQRVAEALPEIDRSGVFNSALSSAGASPSGSAGESQSQEAVASPEAPLPPPDAAPESPPDIPPEAPPAARPRRQPVPTGPYNPDNDPALDFSNNAMYNNFESPPRRAIDPASLAPINEEANTPEPVQPEPEIGEPRSQFLPEEPTAQAEQGSDWFGQPRPVQNRIDFPASGENLREGGEHLRGSGDPDLARFHDASLHHLADRLLSKITERSGGYKAKEGFDKIIRELGHRASPTGTPEDKDHFGELKFKIRQATRAQSGGKAYSLAKTLDNLQRELAEPQNRFGEDAGKVRGLIQDVRFGRWDKLKELGAVLGDKIASDRNMIGDHGPRGAKEWGERVTKVYSGMADRLQKIAPSHEHQPELIPYTDRKSSGITGSNADILQQKAKNPDLGFKDGPFESIFKGSHIENILKQAALSPNLSNQDRAAIVSNVKAAFDNGHRTADRPDFGDPYQRIGEILKRNQQAAGPGQRTPIYDQVNWDKVARGMRIDEAIHNALANYGSANGKGTVMNPAALHEIADMVAQDKKNNPDQTDPIHLRTSDGKIYPFHEGKTTNPDTKRESERTIFVKPHIAQEIADFNKVNKAKQFMLNENDLLLHHEGEARNGVRDLQWYGDINKTRPYSNKPVVGYHPVELFGKEPDEYTFEANHAYNEGKHGPAIVQIGKKQPTLEDRIVPEEAEASRREFANIAAKGLGEKVSPMEIGSVNNHEVASSLRRLADYQSRKNKAPEDRESNVPIEADHPAKYARQSGRILSGEELGSLGVNPRATDVAKAMDSVGDPRGDIVALADQHRRAEHDLSPFRDKNLRSYKEVHPDFSITTHEPDLSDGDSGRPVRLVRLRLPSLNRNYEALFNDKDHKKLMNRIRRLSQPEKVIEAAPLPTDPRLHADPYGKFHFSDPELSGPEYGDHESLAVKKRYYTPSLPEHAEPMGFHGNPEDILQQMKDRLGEYAGAALGHQMGFEQFMSPEELQDAKFWREQHQEE